jgi:hypothetical protein
VLRVAGALKCAAVVIGVLLALGASAAAASPLSWSAPRLADDALPFGDVNEMSGVSCPSASLCVAVDIEGQAVTSTDPTGGSSAWTAALIDRPGVVEGEGRLLTGVSCPAVSLCVAVNANGDVLTSTDPSGGGDAWEISHINGTSSLTGVSCPSVSLCVAVGGNGDVISSTNPTGGASAWSLVHVGPEQPYLSGISCPSQSLCVAVGSGEIVSSGDPTGGASAWSAKRLGLLGPFGSLQGVNCPSQSLCVAVTGETRSEGGKSVAYGDVLTSTNPTEGVASWRLTNVDHESWLDSVSCASVSLCVAVDSGGNAFTATDPTGGSSAWSAAHVDEPTPVFPRGPVLTVSCPSASLCVAGDESGRVVTSSDPAAGTASAWAPAITVDATDRMSALSCPTVSRCFALDDAGRIVTATNPAAPEAAWRAFPLANLANPAFAGEAISCASTLPLCVAKDVTYNGRKGRYVSSLAISTHPSLGPQAWKPSSSEFLAGGISCPSKRLCVAATTNDIATSTRPTVANSWILHGVEPGGGLITSVACPSVRLCVAIDVRGNVLTSTHPAGPARLWKIEHIDMTRDSTGKQSVLYAVSCPTSKLCIAFDSDGNVFFSTRPTGSARAWKHLHLSGAIEAKDMTCPSTSLCVGLAGGNVATVTNPTRRNAVWTVTPVDPDSYLVSLSCPSASLCIAGDTHGYILVGRRP